MKQQSLMPAGSEKGCGDTGNRCQVALFHQDSVTCKPLLGIGQLLSEKFHREIDFDFTWWGFKCLQDDLIPSLAAQTAAKADGIAISACSHTAVAPEIQLLNTVWFKLREGRKGGLLILVQNHGGRPRGTIAMDRYLQELAALAHMDFRSRLLQVDAAEAMPPAQLEAPARVATRSALVGVDAGTPSDDPLGKPPGQWGLNE